MEHSLWELANELAYRKICETKGRDEPDDFKMFLCTVDPKYKRSIWETQLKKYRQEQEQKELWVH